ncbi:hypothetical protein MJO28_012094 [Puccinia striiformis f. sp. tritici]|uniref:Uncharacterized protein n=1 Tax=Puccinia striiformis f. sp. tritici TaxID=168172 RepID=A0ACC0DZH0_9BASI|nr:hypothetical protein MJO28_012094 [Puccinia striiformis f. sp. tritici]
MSQGHTLVDFAKYMMGTRSNFDLPPEPTSEEIHWREKFADCALRGGPHPSTQSDLPEYHPSTMLDHAKFNASDKNRCDLDFRSRGFARITFEWRKSNLSDSEWNRCTAEILCDHWGIWVINERISSTDSSLDAKSVLEQWLVSSYADFTQKRERMAAGQQIVVPDFDDHTLRHMKYRQQVIDSRFRTALAVFPDQPNFLALFRDPDTVSDYEDSEDITILPTRIVPSWRSKVFTSIVRAIDVATIQLAQSEKKTAIMRWLSRIDERNLRENEESYERIPSGLPFDAYDRDFIEKTSTLEHRQLRIVKKNQDFTLDEALEHLKLVTGSSFGLYM